MESGFELVDILLVSPAIAVFIASLIPLTIKVFRGNNEPNTFATMMWAFIGLIAAAALSISSFGVEKTAFNKALIFDGLSSWSTLIVLLLTAFSLLFARESKATNSKQFSEFIFLLMNSAIGMMFLSWANDLIVTFIAIEIMSLCLYILIAMSHEEILSKEAAFKYFILGSFGSAILLYGISFIYGVAGTTYINELAKVGAELVATNRLFLIGVVLVLIGLCFKAGLAPFHAWTPDVYEGSPTAITGFMATGVKVVTFTALLRLVTTQFLNSDRSQDLVTVLQWIAVGSMLLGNIAAIKQDSLKRMLAYSRISHSGYALVGIIAAGFGDTGLAGASGTIFYIFSYTLITLGTFGFVSLFEKREDTILMISDLKGLSRRRPWMALAMAILLMSLAGIPPTVGFFGKFYIFASAISQGLFWLAIWGVISSVISVYYYLRPIVLMYMNDEDASEIVKTKSLTIFGVGVMASLTLLVGLFSDPFYQFVVKSVARMF